ncbi:undecaprenyl-phosphate glucose phosphotransferase [Mucilaginibacter aquaedulcis]|uniref:undecaprenyl-phosphate glucose phosphotransferase n=1 Tax=Mucilaginibacter aquaedulcis TaxID=1187081 RepID=UPI0025B31351|nr:undecaprenyl-phosphate glucose phosphotransferase [Mucilaginibacter aquaedulcis]MDN3550473.1 undecaprenyl-phosphate glucose phosphotransferase [Mucilaginibacter aquaedulcis]
MKTQYLYLLYFVLRVTDLILINLCFIAAFKILNSPFEDYINFLFVSNYMWILAASICGVYKGSITQKHIKIYNGSIKTFILFAIFFLSFVVIAKDFTKTVKFTVIYFNLIFIGLIVSRFLGTLIEFIIKRFFNVNKSVAVLGNNSMGLRLAMFFENAENHFSFKGFLNKDDGSAEDSEHPSHESVTKYILNAAANGVNEVYVTMPIDKIADANYLMEVAEKHCVRLKFVPDWDTYFKASFKVNYMDDFPILSLRQEPLEEMENRFVKRLFDIVFSSLVLIFILSWLYPILGLIIKLQSPGPILYKQLRSGKDNQPFICYKFRSMQIQDDGKFIQATKNDSRVTPIGRFIRKTSIDELPQFINVLFGDMSVIGPRPHILSMTEQYGEIIHQYMVRHFLKSGITGWAQVNGFRGETKNTELMEKRVEHDIWYLENWSLKLDIKIVFMTIYNIFKGETNAY